ncbi:MAG: dTDP-4-dehydrorhamnose reductase [Thermoleophilia bacterium]|nr:dTDP-4-dehydrorhamnose reductase [Thermoleophilia bacterium]
MEHDRTDPLRARFPRVLITGAGGQLGAALAEAFPWAEALDRGALDVTRPLPPGVGPVDLVLHCAAWTDVDGAESDPAGAHAVNVVGTRRIVALGAPVVYFSSDYVFDGAKGSPYIESDPTGPLSVYGRTKLDGEREVRAGWVVRTSWLFGWTGRNFVRTMLALGGERETVRVVDDQRGSPTFTGHLAAATRELVSLPHGLYHVAAGGDCTWAGFAEAIFEQAGLPCRVERISSAELGRPAPRPARSVLRSERPGTPRLPPWREGLAACLARLPAR